jgi:hypothetical protein
LYLTPRSSRWVDDGRDGRPQPSYHQPTRPVDREKAETELAQNIKKATSPDETAPSTYKLFGRLDALNSVVVMVIVIVG